MNTILKKIGLNEKMARNFWGIIIIALGGAIIYGLPYFRYDYYNAYLEVYNLKIRRWVYSEAFWAYSEWFHISSEVLLPTDFQQEQF